MTSVHRIVVPIDSQTQEAWDFALTYAIKICTSFSPKIENVVLLIHTKHQIRHTSLASFLGDVVIKRLNAGGEVGLASGIKLRLATKQTLSTFTTKTVVIVYYAEGKILELVDGLKNVSGVIAVPDLPNDCEQWIERWNPIVHGEAQKAPVKLITDPVIENALRSITSLINLANGVLVSRDKEHVQDALRLLRAKGHVAEPKAIRSWAIQNGWPNGAAADLASLSAKIFGLKTKPSLKGMYEPESRYRRWTDGSEI
jgi:hypothetical protein